MDDPLTRAFADPAVDGPPAAGARATPIGRRLIRRLQAKQSTIAIVGLGYVGLPLLLRFAERKMPSATAGEQKESTFYRMCFEPGHY